MDLTRSLPETVARCLSPSAPAALRISVAKGAVPLPPMERVTVLCALMIDKQEQVRSEARAAWDATPAFFFDTAVADSRISGDVLDLVAALKHDVESLVIKILEHPEVRTRTLRRFAGGANASMLTRIAENHRLLETDVAIVRMLLKNPNLHPEDRGKLSSLYSAIADEIEKENHQAQPQAQTQAQEQLQTQAQAEPQSQIDQEEPDAEEEGKPSKAAADSLKALPRELFDEEAEIHKKDSQNVYKLVQTLSMSEKIKLAMMGGKSARRLLLRDSNRMVSSAVMRNPKMREDEVQVIAQDRTTTEETIRIIMARKDWMKCYPVRVALCNNPKTPLPKALKLLDTLQERDLRSIAKSKHVPSAVSGKALRTLLIRGKT